MRATVSHPRVLVRLAAGAGLRLVVHYRGDDRAERFVNAVIDVDAGERSELQIYRLQQQGAKSFQIERIEAALAREARLVVRDASLGASLARLDLRARLAGSRRRPRSSPGSFSPTARVISTRSCASSTRPAARPAMQDYRGIAAGRGRGVINSRVVVNEGAQKSVPGRPAATCCSAPGAEIDTKPELEIHADDVQCNHGATTGQLDPAGPLLPALARSRRAAPPAAR